VLPEIVLGRSKGDLDKRPPLRSLRFADQAHVCFTRKPVALARIARDAGANHDLAFKQLAIAIRNPSDLSYGQLKLMPFWDPLRGDPRFEQIVASLAPKEN